jgi:hypothetical protein
MPSKDRGKPPKPLITQNTNNILEAILEDQELRERLPGLVMIAERNEVINNWPKWSSESLECLRKEFSEANILRLMRANPTRLVDLTLTRKAWKDARKLRFFARDSLVFVSEELKGKKGWGMCGGKPIYVATSSRIAKIDLLIEDLEERVSQLYNEEREASIALKRSKEAAKQFAKAGQDEKLAGALWHALGALATTTGFVYFKRWSMNDSICWFKLGITNNPNRRESEQNVLPVAAETIACVEVGSMDRARAIEAAIHKVLEDWRITNANNREIFHLTDQQASAVKAVLQKLQ